MGKVEYGQVATELGNVLFNELKGVARGKLIVIQTQLLQFFKRVHSIIHSIAHLARNVDSQVLHIKCSIDQFQQSWLVQQCTRQI